MDLPTGRTALLPKPSCEFLTSRSGQSSASPLPLVEVIQMLPAAPRWVCTLFNEQRKQPARNWGLEDPLLHIKDTINWGQMKQCAGVCVYCLCVERVTRVITTNPCRLRMYPHTFPFVYCETRPAFWLQFTWFCCIEFSFWPFYIAQWWQPRCNCDHLLSKCYFINTPECRSLQFYFPLLCLPGICSVICLRP